MTTHCSLKCEKRHDVKYDSLLSCIVAKYEIGSIWRAAIMVLPKRRMGSRDR